GERNGVAVDVVFPERFQQGSTAARASTYILRSKSLFFLHEKWRSSAPFTAQKVDRRLQRVC
ncbi:MAG: hypothetical protein M3N07_10245, partial [Pseudomonadota bacterium]|nr:hypothetical protein [Pseudomonadota bacterium]